MTNEELLRYFDRHTFDEYMCTLDKLDKSLTEWHTADSVQPNGNYIVICIDASGNIVQHLNELKNGAWVHYDDCSVLMYRALTKEDLIKAEKEYYEDNYTNRD